MVITILRAHGGKKACVSPATMLQKIFILNTYTKFCVFFTTYSVFRYDFSLLSGRTYPEFFKSNNNNKCKLNKIYR